MAGGERREPADSPQAGEPDERSASGGGPPEEDSPSFAESLRVLRDLGRDVADVPSAIRRAPARVAARPPPGGGPLKTPGRLRRAVRAAAWPLVAIATSAGVAVVVALLAR